MAEGGVLARASRPRHCSQGWRSRYRESLPCHRLLLSRRHCSTCDPTHEQLLARLGAGGAAFVVGGGCRVVPRGVQWCWDCSSPLLPLSSSGSTCNPPYEQLLVGMGVHHQSSSSSVTGHQLDPPCEQVLTAVEGSCGRGGSPFQPRCVEMLLILFWWG
jgi:hypothetical protein